MQKLMKERNQEKKKKENYYKLLKLPRLNSIQVLPWLEIN